MWRQCFACAGSTLKISRLAMELVQLAEIQYIFAFQYCDAVVMKHFPSMSNEGMTVFSDVGISSENIEIVVIDSATWKVAMDASVVSLVCMHVIVHS